MILNVVFCQSGGGFWSQLNQIVRYMDKYENDITRINWNFFFSGKYTYGKNEIYSQLFMTYDQSDQSDQAQIISTNTVIDSRPIKLYHHELWVNHDRSQFIRYSKAYYKFCQLRPEILKMVPYQQRVSQIKCAQYSVAIIDRNLYLSKKEQYQEISPSREQYISAIQPYLKSETTFYLCSDNLSNFSYYLHYLTDKKMNVIYNPSIPRCKDINDHEPVQKISKIPQAQSIVYDSFYEVYIASLCQVLISSRTTMADGVLLLNPFIHFVYVCGALGNIYV